MPPQFIAGGLEEPSARARFRSLQQMIPRRTHPLLICLYELRARITIGHAGCSIIDKSKLEVEQIDSGEVGLDSPPIRAADELLLDEGNEGRQQEDEEEH